MINEREKNFFNEISLNPQLKDQHPLMHLITSQQKLRMVDEQAGVNMDASAAKKEGLFSTAYGKQGTDAFVKLEAYTVEQPYILQGKIIRPSRLRKLEVAKKKEYLAKKEAKKAKKKMLRQMSSGQLSAGDLPPTPSGASGAGPPSIADSDSLTASTAISSTDLSSKRHTDFLKDTLKEIEGEVDRSKKFTNKDITKYTNNEPPREMPYISKASKDAEAAAKAKEFADIDHRGFGEAKAVNTGPSLKASGKKSGKGSVNFGATNITEFDKNETIMKASSRGSQDSGNPNLSAGPVAPLSPSPTGSGAPYDGFDLAQGSVGSMGSTGSLAMGDSSLVGIGIPGSGGDGFDNDEFAGDGGMPPSGLDAGSVVGIGDSDFGGMFEGGSASSPNSLEADGMMGAAFYGPESPIPSQRPGTTFSSRPSTHNNVDLEDDES